MRQKPDINPLNATSLDFEKEGDPVYPFGKPMVLNHNRNIPPPEPSKHPARASLGFTPAQPVREEPGVSIISRFTLIQGSAHSILVLPLAKDAQGEYVVKCAIDTPGAHVRCQGVDTLDQRSSSKAMAPGQVIRFYSDEQSWWLV
jgi:hypothetical protein